MGWGRARRLRANGVIQVGLMLLLCVALLGGLTHVTSAQATAPGTHRAQAAAFTQPAAGKAAPQRPNVVLIMTDDQSLADMSVMRTVRNRIGRAGTTFTNAFSPYPLCCPARATILTGQYAQNHHVLANTAPWGGFTAFDDSDTLPIWLQAAGYRTAVLGKYLNGYPDPDDPSYVPPGWDDWRVPVDGIYNYRNFTLNRNGYREAHHRTYQTDVVGDEAVSIIDDMSGKQPFFLWAGFLAPHEGGPKEPDDPDVLYPGSRIGSPTVAPEHRNELRGLRLPDKASINERNVSDKPAYIRKMDLRPRGALRELNQQRLESLLSVDEQVDRILDALKANGELGNTLVIFTSDNGFLVGEHRRVGKVIGYEESIRVPLIISGPGFDSGVRRSQKVSLVDLAPTIAQAAGATPGLTQDGVSLRKFSMRPGSPDSRTVLLQAGPIRSGSDQRWYTGIRTDRYVYLRYFTHEYELYDLQSDPLELDNLVTDPDYNATQQQLAAALDRLQDCAGKECRETVNQLAGH